MIHFYKVFANDSLNFNFTWLMYIHVWVLDIIHLSFIWDFFTIHLFSWFFLFTNDSLILISFYKWFTYFDQFYSLLILTWFFTNDSLIFMVQLYMIHLYSRVWFLHMIHLSFRWFSSCFTHFLFFFFFK